MKGPLPDPETGRVAALNSDGEGVVREGKAAFVAGALPGELVRFQRRTRHPAYDEAALLEVVEASAERVAPRCSAFGVCGGCSLQHLEHGAQLRSKDQELRDALSRIGKVEPLQWAGPLQGPQWAYRRRARLGARYVTNKGRSLVGFRERLSSFVADIARCEILAEPIGAMLPALGEVTSRLSIRMRMPQIEVAVADNAIVLVFRTLLPLTADDRSLLAAFEREQGVTILLQAGRPDDLEPLSGATPDLWYALPEFDVKLHFRPSDFIQVNAQMNQRLVGHVLQQLQLGPDSTVLDLFCGLGNFTLPLARRAARVVGIEGEEGLVQRARDNAAANGLAHAAFHTANLAGPEAAAECLRLARQHGDYSHILLDPPRTGARDVLPAVAALAPQRVVYVSCHPGSLARDLDILVNEHGFRLESAGIADMFPHTNHVESVAVLDGTGRRA
ncbi:MAG: hypothetical protein RL026_290 [Pseudomonadota bacterium]|jgi:23S rRNA (uracil1939-C5)-methyltransferase